MLSIIVSVVVSCVCHEDDDVGVVATREEVIATTTGGVIYDDMRETMLEDAINGEGPSDTSSRDLFMLRCMPYSDYR